MSASSWTRFLTLWTPANSLQRTRKTSMTSEPNAFLPLPLHSPLLLANPPSLLSSLPLLLPPSFPLPFPPLPASLLPSFTLPSFHFSLKPQSFKRPSISLKHFLCRTDHEDLHRRYKFVKHSILLVSFPPQLPSLALQVHVVFAYCH